MTWLIFLRMLDQKSGRPMNLLKGPVNLYGKSDAINEEIEAATSATNAHSFITLLPNGYNIQVGEQGVQLSGGTKTKDSYFTLLLLI
ncbi:ABC transporter B family member [Trifolium repens]|nr:ABC transporter B family member [Trifolium repens]